MTPAELLDVVTVAVLYGTAALLALAAIAMAVFLFLEWRWTR